MPFSKKVVELVAEFYFEVIGELVIELEKSASTKP
jgi:hypothetical protein